MVSVIVGGDTEVIIEVRDLNATTSASLGTTQTVRHNGGSFVFREARTLDQDMRATLRATLLFYQSVK
jgi:hypothetical protein